jgi:hypothetical protein
MISNQELDSVGHVFVGVADADPIDVIEGSRRTPAHRGGGLSDGDQCRRPLFGAGQGITGQWLRIDRGQGSF